MALWITIGLAVGASACAQQVAAAPYAGAHYAGIYITSPRREKAEEALPADAYRLTGVDGIALRYVWNALEPAPGHFDWGALDSQMRASIAGGKQVSIGIVTGAFTPDWVYARGVASGRFVIGPHGGRNGNCRDLRLPTPWSPAYEAAFADLMRSLAQHLHSQPRFYDATRIVKLSPIVDSTLETRMAATPGHGAEDGGCAESDAIATWLALGYRPSKILAAWQTMIAAVGQAFPDKLIAMAILQASGFPPIDEQGKIDGRSDESATGLSRALIESALRQFPRRFAVQWNALQGPAKLSQTVLWAGRHGAVIGWQTNEHRGVQGAACPSAADRKAPCSEVAYEDMLKYGIANGAQYLEIWYPDAIRFPAAVARASRALGGSR